MNILNFVLTSTTLLVLTSTALVAEPAKNPSTFEVLYIPLIAFFAIFYFLIIRPQSKRAKQQQQLISSLKKGDEIITTSGIYGIITGLTDTVATLEISSNVKIKLLRSNIAGLAEPNSPSKSK